MRSAGHTSAGFDGSGLFGSSRKVKSSSNDPGLKPFPKYLLMAMVEPDRPLYVSVGYDRARDYLHVITVHWFDPRKWEDPWTRKPKPPKLRREKEP